LEPGTSQTQNGSANHLTVMCITLLGEKVTTYFKYLHNFKQIVNENSKFIEENH
jgi:hypothetical protein